MAQVDSGDYEITNGGNAPLEVTRGGVTVSMQLGDTLQSLPQTKQDRRIGGWAAYGVFKNRGRCIAHVATNGN